MNKNADHDEKDKNGDSKNSAPFVVKRKNSQALHEGVDNRENH